jgi:RNA 2',3'-cyclic 3'-phosphodiesterase
MPRMTRIFLALELDDATRAHIVTASAPLHAAMPHLRFTAPESWHITIAFLGELDDPSVEAAKQAADRAASQSSPFTLHAGGIGYFGSPAAPRVLWIGVTGDLAALTALHEHTAAALSEVGLSHDGRFAPHITLARPRQPLTADEAEALAAARAVGNAGPSLPVTHLSVMRSDLLPTGARYTRMHAAELGNI